jgi:hypothetical protein
MSQRGDELGWMEKGRMAVEPYSIIAKNILSGKGYVDNDNPNRINFERLPLYVYFLVGVYEIWGPELWKLQIVQAVLDTLSCLFIFIISMRIFHNDRVSALLAAFLYAVYFKMINLASRPLTETLFILLLLIFIMIFLDSFKKEFFAFLAGILLGMLTLIKPITLLFPFVVALLYVFKTKNNWIKRVTLFSFGLGLIILPFVIRNYGMEGRVFFATGGGKALYMGAVINYSKDFRQEELRLMDSIKLRYDIPRNIEDDKKLTRKALKIIIENPWEYIKKVAYRFYLFWTYPDYTTKMMALKTILVFIFNIILLALTAFGLYLSKKHAIFYSPLLLLIFYFYIVFALIYSHSRYSVPLYPILFIFSAYGLINLLRKYHFISAYKNEYLIKKNNSLKSIIKSH